jgi:hypothetical protein
MERVTHLTDRSDNHSLGNTQSIISRRVCTPLLRPLIVPMICLIDYKMYGRILHIHATYLFRTMFLG